MVACQSIFSLTRVCILSYACRMLITQLFEFILKVIDFQNKITAVMLRMPKINYFAKQWGPVGYRSMVCQASVGCVKITLALRIYTSFS